MPKVSEGIDWWCMMIDMKNLPPKPTPQNHHGQLKWTTRWRDRNGQHAQRFGMVDKVSRKAANAAYVLWLAKWIKQSERTRNVLQCSVLHLCDEFRKYAKKKYRIGERMTSSFTNIDLALRDLSDTFGERIADDVRAPEISALRDEVFMYHWTPTGKKLDADKQPVIHSVCTVNYRLQCVKKAYKHGRSLGLLSAETLLDVLSVSPVSERDSKAIAPVDVPPVSDEHVDAVVDVCSQSLGDMIQVQRLSGMRPGEVCSMRPCDLDTSVDDVWFYEPAEHKTQHLNKSRIIALPPAAVEILRPYISRPVQSRCFTPREHAEQSTSVKIRFAGNEWTKDTYRRAIAWACKRAGIPTWKPNQLRHAWATEVRRKIGIEAVREGLSHQSTKTSEIYAELSKEKLIEMARRLG